ncbi:sodium/solute symporter [Haloterrigena sp. SYSU A121-1]|uniref:Sodium/solute symporter n=1 Tax=Haloterrigena gelatinilytica TaxID=2741724 RepID=A0A8J8GP03_9EURY|nr:sodium/solute symporter [Haloterrigena gelatinilytica]NUB93653.1 sodium/solute symporter [Haloterrigena gelatinilytica]
MIALTTVRPSPLQGIGGQTLVLTEWIAVCVFIVGLVVFGAYMRRNTADSASTFLADRSLPPSVQAFSTVATNLNANDFLGLAGFAYAYGIIVLLGPITNAIAIVLATVAIIPFIRQIQAFSLGEWLTRRFSRPVGDAYDFIWTFVWMFVNMGLYIYAGSLVLNTLLGWNLWLSMGAIIVVGTAYTILGGFGAVAGSDTIQFVLMFVPLILLLPVSLYMVGGISGLIDGLATHQASMTPSDHPLAAEFPVGGPIAVFLLYFGFLASAISYWSAESQVLQRPLSAEDPESAQVGYLYTSIWYAILVPLFILVPGLVAAVLYPNLEIADHAMPMLISEVMPPGLYGVVVVGLIAGVLSSVDSQLNNFQTLFTERIYRRYVAPDRKPSHYVRVGRIAGIVFMVACIGVAYLFSMEDSMYLVAQSILATIMPTFAAVAIVGGLWDRSTSAGAILGIAIGLAVSVYMGFALGHEALYSRSLYAFLLVTGIVVTVSLLTTPKAHETPTNFVESSLTGDSATLTQRVKRIAVVTIGVAFALLGSAIIIFQA